MKPKALDLFCCAGGTARGLQLAGYHVTGVDIRPQPRYVGDVFIQADAMELDWSGYDLIWASPPCQRYSVATPDRTRDQHPDLLPEVIDRLRTQPTPYICENVPGTEMLMRNPVMLCGSMFDLRVQRHRWFEIGNVPDLLIMTPPCGHWYVPILITCTSKRLVKGKRIEYRKHEKEAAIGIDWMVTTELDQAIPPAYSRFLAERIMEATCQPPQPPRS